MPPVSNEIDGAYYFAFVHPSIRLSVHQAFLCIMGKQCRIILGHLTPMPYLSNNLNKSILLLMCVKTAGLVANSEDPDQMQQFVAIELSLHCLLRPVCPNT